MDIKLSEQLTIADLEEDINSSTYSFKEKDILIDFSEVKYIEVTSLLYLISFIQRSNNANQNIKIKLPDDINVRNIFRIWRFPIVLKEVTGKPFSSYVLDEDLKYFGENKALKGDYYDQIGYDEEGVRKLLEKGFFSLTSLPFNTEEEKQLTIDFEFNNWTDLFVKKVLDKHLGIYDNVSYDIDLVPRIIIKECLTNAYRHPKANTLIRGSFFDRLGNYFTIQYWDNGLSLIDTLKEPIINNQKIRAEFDVEQYAQKLFSNFILRYYSKKDSRINIYCSDVDPSKNSLDYEVLLACFFPGISRDPEGKHDFVYNVKIDAKSPGMGLTYLLIAVVDIMKGSISLRTKDFFLNIRHPRNKEKKEFHNDPRLRFEKTYYAKILDYKTSMPSFLGNMITIRLPLRYASRYKTFSV